VDEAAEGQLREIAQAVAQGEGRMVVRWVDEGRIMPAEKVGEREGFAVRRVVQATLTYKADGGAVQATIEGLELGTIRRVLSEYAVDVLYRSDNITR
jgi:hypothetical protein